MGRPGGRAPRRLPADRLRRGAAALDISRAGPTFSEPSRYVVETETAKLLEQLLDEWRAKYPDVAVSQDVVHGYPGRALAGLSADDAIAAARAGDSGEMRRHLRRFDALTSAIWTVQDAVYGSRQVRAAP
jgi:hypothetical protein